MGDRLHIPRDSHNDCMRGHHSMFVTVDIYGHFYTGGGPGGPAEGSACNHGCTGGGPGKCWSNCF